MTTKGSSPNSHGWVGLLSLLLDKDCSMTALTNMTEVLLCQFQTWSLGTTIYKQSTIL